MVRLFIGRPRVRNPLSPTTWTRYSIDSAGGYRLSREMIYSSIPLSAVGPILVGKPRANVRLSGI